MTASKFKDDMLGVSGITYKAMTKGRYFIGLKKKPEIMEEEENQGTYSLFLRIQRETE